MTQEELDRIKWEKSVNLGYDACGSFNYCSKCDKYQQNPCLKAFNKYNGVEEKTLVVDVEQSKVVAAVEPKAPSKKTTKKTTAKKATKKKSTTKKSTTKSTKKTTSKSSKTTKK